MSQSMHSIRARQSNALSDYRYNVMWIGKTRAYVDRKIFNNVDSSLLRMEISCKFPRRNRNNPLYFLTKEESIHPGSAPIIMVTFSFFNVGTRSTRYNNWFTLPDRCAPNSPARVIKAICVRITKIKIDRLNLV